MGNKLIICGKSAIEYWRTTAGANVADAASAPRRPPRSCDAAYAAALRAMEDLGLPAPLHLLSEGPRQRKNSSGARYHYHRHDPRPEDLICLSDQLLVCSPALAYCQLATETDAIGLALVALELCGTYVLSPADERGFVSTSRPLVAYEELLGRVASGEGLPKYARAKASAALDLVQPGSNSPAESKVFAFFSLGRSYGGLSLPGMALNQRLALNNEGRAILGADRIRPDFYFPQANTAGEYKSKQYHPEGTWTNDDRRIDAMEAIGLHTFTLNNERVRSLRELSGIGSVIAKRLGIRREPPSQEELELRASLHSRLFLDGGCAASGTSW